MPRKSPEIRRIATAVTLPEDLRDRLEDWRNAQPVAVSRTQIIEHLLRKFLKEQGYT